MAERATAGDQLVRILTLLPFAVREPDVGYGELEARTGYTRRQIIDDLTEVYTRSFYHPAGSADRTQVIIEPERVYVWTTGDFQRPSRLGPGETLAMGLGLRMLAADAVPEEREEILSLATRLEESLGRGSTEELLDLLAPETDRPAAQGVRPVLSACVRERVTCEIVYLKPGAGAPETREVEPYRILAASGFWYVLGRCDRSGGIRAFRLDRILGATRGSARFEVPEDFDPADHLRDRRVLRAPEDVQVTVRYSPRIAQWIAEKWPHETLDDGGVLVRHEVADPRWLVRQVLQYGPDAEVLEPAEYRARVEEAVLKIATAE